MSDGARHSVGRRAQDQVDLVSENEMLRHQIVGLELSNRLEQDLRIKAQNQLAELQRMVGVSIDDFTLETEADHGR